MASYLLPCCLILQCTGRTRVEDCLDSRSLDGMQAFPSIRGGTWLGHGPPDNDGHTRIPTASSISGLTLADAQDQQCLRSLRDLHTAEATGSKPVTPTRENPSSGRLSESS
jgi:hypothetical protein